MNVCENSKELCQHSSTPRVSVFSNIHSCSISIHNDNFILATDDIIFDNVLNVLLTIKSNTYNFSRKRFNYLLKT